MGTKHFEASAVSGIFNAFYCSVASSLVDKLPPVFNLFGFDFCTNFYRRKGIFGPCFTLSPVSRAFIRSQLVSLKTDKSTGLDGIPPRFLKDGADFLVEPIAHIVNFSILSEAVPSGFKNARVKPLYKKGSRLEPGNYRPVSILTVLSKILERAVNDQLNNFLSRRCLLYDFQSGFRKGYSTETCLVNLNDFIRTQTSKGKVTGMVLIDLQKAFDCVDHNLLLSKLSSMGVSSLDWFRSYLTDRYQCTQVSGVDSSFLKVNCGVPQGSILGPTLFLCFINDMSAALSCKLSLYADDSALVYSHSDPRVVSEFLSQELDTCRKWLIDNRLSLHLGKTECILFGPKRKLSTQTSSFNVQVNGVDVKRVTSVKYLGIILDQCLDFSCHIHELVKKANAKLKFLHRNGYLLNLHAKRLLCQALIFSNLEYCASAWFSSLSGNLREMLNVVQRKCARFSLGLGPRSHIGNSEFHSLSWLPFPRRIAFSNLVHTFKVRAGLCPAYMTANFNRVTDMHSYDLRQSKTNFSLARCESPSGTFCRDAISKWNTLPSELKGIESLASFKVRLKRHLQIQSA